MKYSTRRLQYEERMAAIAKGIPLPDLPPVPVRSSFVNLQLRMGNVRRGGIVLVAAGIGAAVFFCVLSWILRERDVLAGAAAAIIPFAIGVGLLIDAWAQEKADFPDYDSGSDGPKAADKLLAADGNRAWRPIGPASESKL